MQKSAQSWSHLHLAPIHLSLLLLFSPSLSSYTSSKTPQLNPSYIISPTLGTLSMCFYVHLEKHSPDLLYHSLSTLAEWTLHLLCSFSAYNYKAAHWHSPQIWTCFKQIFPTFLWLISFIPQSFPQLLTTTLFFKKKTCVNGQKQLHQTFKLKQKWGKTGIQYV